MNGDPFYGSLTFVLAAMACAYLLIGGNLGERERVQRESLAALELECGRLLQRSSLYESAPWGFDHERYFLNRVVKLETSYDPDQLLSMLLGIEECFGREREGEAGYQGRVLDLDILYYDDRIIRDSTLKLPHPRIHERRFTLAPLHEVAPDLFDPLRQKDVRTLLEECPDPLEVKIFEKGCITST